MPAAGQLVDLGEERLRIDDHAVADDAGDARRAECRTAAAAARTCARSRTPCARRCGRPDSARRSKSSASAGRRSFPCPRRPTARPAPLCSYDIEVPKYSTSDFSLPHDDSSRRHTHLTLDATALRIADGDRQVALVAGAPRPPSTPRAPSSIGTPPATRRSTASTPASARWRRSRLPRERARRPPAQPAAQPRCRRRRAAAGTRGARDDGAARQRAGQGLFRDPSRRRSSG